MSKKKPLQISNYYKKQDVVESYDTRRFSGIGGKYINTTEVTSLMAACPSNTSHKTVLDVGAGRGRATIHLKEEKYLVSCLEFSEEMAAVLKNTVKPKKIFKQSVFTPLPKNEKFDVITSLRFFDHFDIKNQHTILSLLVKNLEPKGVLVLTLLNKNSLEGILSSFFPYGRYNFYYHSNEYNLLFKKLGLKQIAKTEAFFIPRGFFLALQNIPGIANILIGLDKFLTSLFPSLTALQVVRLYKKS